MDTDERGYTPVRAGGRPVSSTALRALLLRLPKVELHRHLEASARIETLWELHQETGARRHAGLAAFRAAVEVSDGAPPDYAGFLKRFEALRFSYGLAGVERIVRETVAAAAADGVVHLELRFAPPFWARAIWPASRWPEPSAVDAVLPSPEETESATETIVNAARDEAARRGISVAFIASLGRNRGAEVNALTAFVLGRPVGSAFAALDIAGDEAFPLTHLRPFLESWRAAGRPLVLHAGEDPRPDAPGAAGVREAVEQFGAARVGHGIRAVEDAVVLDLLRERRVPLEICPTSNIHTGAAASYAAHPLGRLLAAGVRVTVNTDDPLISRTSLTEEYARACEDCGLSLDELRQAVVTAAEAAFLDPQARARLVQTVTAAWDRAP